MLKRIVLILLLACTLPMAARTYCVFAGVSNYEGEGLDLLLSTDDAKQFAALYREHGAKVQLLTGVNATSTNILKYVRKMAEISKPEDQIVFFFSGHGVRNSILTYDTENMLSYDTLFCELRKIDCSNIVIYVDACFSGTLYSTRTFDGTEAINSDLERNTGKNDRFIIFASSRNEETSNENRRMKAGYFTNALLNGLRGAADANADREITTMELFKYVYADVTRKLKELKRDQHPNLITNVKKNENVVLMKLD